MGNNNKSTSSWFAYKYCKQCKTRAGHLITKTHYYRSGKTKIKVYCKRCGNRYSYWDRKTRKRY